MHGKKAFSVFAILCLFSVLTTSGCISQSAASGSGVVIENFEVDFQKVYASENFKLQAKIKNVGSVDALNVFPELYNLQSSSQEGQLEISCDGTCPSEITLLAPDAERGTTGETKTCVWNCVAPAIPKGLSVAFNPSVRLYYGYATHTVKSVTIASQDELRSIQNQGGALPSETVSTTTSPVQLSVTVNGPIRYQEDDNSVTFPINIGIQNTGGGTACAGNGCMDTKNWNKVNILFDRGDDTSIGLKSCSMDSEEEVPIDLWKGQSATLTCEIEINVQEAASLVQKNLKFSIYYDYFTDTSTSIEVSGR